MLAGKGTGIGVGTWMVSLPTPLPWPVDGEPTKGEDPYAGEQRRVDGKLELVAVEMMIAGEEEGAEEIPSPPHSHAAAEEHQAGCPVGTPPLEHGRFSQATEAVDAFDAERQGDDDTHVGADAIGCLYCSWSGHFFFFLGRRVRGV